MISVLAIDQGTTKTKAFRLTVDPGDDASGRFTPVITLEHRQIYPRPGWVEHDPLELLDNVKRCVRAGEEQGKLAAIGMDNQGETVIAWDAQTGQPVYNAIVWQDNRTMETIERLRAGGAEQLTRERAGLPLDPYFSASKLRWILDNVPAAKKLLDSGRLRWGTSEVFFLHHLTGVYATDVTTASRTSLMNLYTLEWDLELCRLFGVPAESLPAIQSTTGDFGSVTLQNRSTRLVASVVDQQAALFGHRCFAAGEGKITFGTGAFALVNSGSQPVEDSSTGVVPTLAWRLRDTEPVFAVDGAMYNAASALNWAKAAGIYTCNEDLKKLSEFPACRAGVFFIPALSGLACPHWDRTAAGLWIGLSLDTTKEVLLKSVLEGIAFRAWELLSSLESITGSRDHVSVDGGLTNNAYFCQFLADCLEKEVIVPDSPEITALGTAFFTLLGCGPHRSEQDLPQPMARGRKFLPAKDLKACRKRFTEAVKRAKGWRAQS